MLELIVEVFLKAIYYLFSALFELGVSLVSIFYDVRQSDHSFIMRLFITILGGFVIALLLITLLLVVT